MVQSQFFTYTLTHKKCKRYRLKGVYVLYWHYFKCVHANDSKREVCLRRIRPYTHNYNRRHTLQRKIDYLLRIDLSLVKRMSRNIRTAVENDRKMLIQKSNIPPSGQLKRRYASHTGHCFRCPSTNFSIFSRFNCTIRVYSRLRIFYKCYCVFEIEQCKSVYYISSHNNGLIR